MTLWPDNSKKNQTKKPKQNEGIKKDANKNLEININGEISHHVKQRDAENLPIIPGRSRPINYVSLLKPTGCSRFSVYLNAIKLADVLQYI